MNIVIDVLIVVFVLLGALAGWKKGLIKSAVNLLGLVAIVIISYALKGGIANFFIEKLPFFNFAGSFEGLTSINILIYNLIAFIIVFAVLYCILSIIIAVTGFIDTLLKLTVIWVLPSKIGGAIIGFLEAWVFVFLVVFSLSQFSLTTKYVMDTKLGNFMLEHTPIISNVLGNATNAVKDIYAAVEEAKGDETKTDKDINLTVLQYEINYNLISKEQAQTLIDIGKIDLGNVMIGEGKKLWLNI